MLDSLNYPIMRFFDYSHCCAALKYLEDHQIDYLEYYNDISACWTFIITDSKFDVDSALTVINYFASLHRSTLGKIQPGSFYGMRAGDQKSYKDGYRKGCEDTLQKAIQCLERNAAAYKGKLGIYDAINMLRSCKRGYNET